MLIAPTSIPGVLLITPKRFVDARGWFCESWNARRLSEHGVAAVFVQDNHSFSSASRTLRGLHFQTPPHAQDKLVRCVRGAVLDVAVDARKGSPTYGEWFAMELSAGTGNQLFVPAGCLHGFITLTEETEVEYKCSDFYAPECDGTVRWNSLGIDWGTDGPILSDRDRNAPSFTEWRSPFVWNGQ
jgi:dTDP-4-dehydrorhamnose 3,5-epimerase